MSLLDDIKDFFFPRQCICCGKILASEEDGVCLDCLSGLPYTGLLNSKGNEIERMFWGIFPIERAASLFYYSKGGSMAGVLHGMKYYKRKKLCRTMGRIMAVEMIDSGFFNGIDYVLPIPLHKERLKKRGYNQSEQLAVGISDITGIPLAAEAVIRTHNNATQTRKSGFERLSNVEGLFALTANSACLEGKHVLVIDDVLTTGATISSCIDVLKDVKRIRISVVTLAWAK